MPKKISPEELDRLWKSVDTRSAMTAMVWSINAPRCLCDLCFQSWLDWGKRLVEDEIMSLENYDKDVKEEEFHREQRRIAREIDKEKMEARLTAAFGGGA